MKIVQGFVQDVLDKGEGDKAYAIIGIAETSKNRNGFDQTLVVEFQVRGEALKRGLHNAYRALKGSEVFAPFDVEIDTYYKDNPRIRYNLSGPPVRLASQASQASASPSSSPALASK